MAEDTPTYFVFPRWANYLLPGLVLMVIGGATYLPTLAGFGASPKTTDVGYQPEQPVPFSHALHAGQLALDCRMCHYTVDKAGFAAVPPTQVCMNCHTNIKPDSPKLVPVMESWKTDRPLPWTKVHDLPDFTYFNHSAHINQGVGCVSCHGRVDQMDVIYQAQPLSMSWCLECHRAPERFLRPRDEVTNLAWRATDHPAAKEKGITNNVEAQRLVGAILKKEYGIRDVQYMQSCSTCHR